MAEFDEKLNALLSDPNSMAQIMQLAQSLGGGQQAGPQGPPPPPNAPPPAGGGFFGPPQGSFPPPPPAPGFGSGGGGNPLSSLLGGLDPKLLSRLLPLAQELGAAQNTNSRALLYALRPYLKTERQAKIERALQLARIVHVGRKFFSSWEG